MENEKKQGLTPISDLGEFGLIEHLTGNNESVNSSTLFAVGDDAAVIDHEGEVTLTSTDMLVEGVHFDLAYMPLKHLGYKAAVVNFSDIYAMNGQPKQLLVSVALSSRFPVEAISEVYQGIYAACKRFDVDLVGGDTTSSTSGLVLSLTVLGTAAEKNVVYRKGAKPTDLLVVSGDLGGAYMGLQVLEREKQVFKANPNAQPELQGNEYVLEKQLKPEARRDVVDTLAGLKIKPTSMIDISDGLSSEVMHLCKASDTGCRIYEDKIPIDESVYRLCEEMKLNATTVVLGGGEDYELLFTVPIEEHEKISTNPNFTIIGHITEEEEGLNLVTRADQLIPLQAQGWNPLKND